jgi:alpha 1,2-mannosyltransferase
MDFYRSPAYSAYFSKLESTGNFYYERWGDAPVHSIAASLFLDKNQIHFWSDMGYRHDPFTHCPQGEEHTKGKCSCDPADNYDYTG